MSDFNIKLGNKIKELRNENNMTQEEFCNKLTIKYNRGNLSKIEKGKLMPSAEFIRSVIETFKVSANWLLDIEETIDRDKTEQLGVEYLEVNKQFKEKGFKTRDIKNLIKAIENLTKK
ncbi:helix-turn-helix transcriptional regulator [Wukongibacter baidiensis]|uniref:helix-turn-helix domain-containing protein n=1 Tax=Wukongibacter baidiensis TaxID=1723361 RepID=UPI003D7FE163